MTHRGILLAGATLVALAAASSRGQTDGVAAVLAPLRAAYDADVKAALAAPPPDGGKSYAEALNRVAAASQKAGDLDGVLAVRAEKSRWEATRVIPEPQPGESLHPGIARAREEYRGAAAEDRRVRARRVLARTEKFLTTLEALKRDWTRAGRIDEAIEVRYEIDRVRLRPEVTAAQFALADESGRTPPTPAPPEESAPPAGLRTEVSFRKAVESRGGMDGDWSRTTVQIRCGDHVSLDASGSWRCTGQSSPCGPEGYGASVREGREPSLPYGALIYRIGSSAPCAVGTGTNFVSEVDGYLFVDANVPPGRTGRAGCSGSINLAIEVKRPLPPAKAAP